MPKKNRKPVVTAILRSGIRVFESHHDIRFEMPAQRHRFPELLYIREGKGRITFGAGRQRRVIDFGSGDAVIVPAETDHSIEDREDAPISLCGLSMDPDKVSVCAELQRVLPSGKIPRQSVRLMKVEPQLRRLLYLSAQSNPVDALSAVAAAIDLFCSVAKSHHSDVGSQKVPPAGAKNEIEVYVEWLKANFFEPVTLDHAADACGFSRRKFTEVFKRKTGTTWLAYLHDLRVSHAKKLLCETDGQVTSVAFQSGFEDVSSFYRIFKKHTGLPPLEFRRGS